MNGERRIVLALECDFPGYLPYEGRCSYDHAQSFKLISSAADLVFNLCHGKAVFSSTHRHLSEGNMVILLLLKWII